MADGMTVWLFFFPGAMLCGFGLDLLIGDPGRFPHPVRGMGKLIVWGEGWLRRGRAEGQAASQDESQAGSRLGLMAEIGGKTEAEAGVQVSAKRERLRGAALVAITIGATLACCVAVLWVCFRIHPALAFAAGSVMCWQCVSVRDLSGHARNVYGFLAGGDLPGARRAVAMIVGRDTEALDGEGVCKAAMESIVENTADGVVAPLFYAAIGGPCFGMVYKAVNTLDSMIGYKNERYLQFGRAAARLDDAFGYVPARVAALCMIAASALLGQDGRGALRIWRRDRRNHASPNSAQCEAVLAGALGVALAGDASYFGKTVHKPVIGDAGRPVAPEDIRTASRILYATSFVFLPIAFLASIGVSWLCCYFGVFPL